MTSNKGMPSSKSQSYRGKLGVHYSEYTRSDVRVRTAEFRFIRMLCPLVPVRWTVAVALMRIPLLTSVNVLCLVCGLLKEK
jgi:hypothetical protein